METLEGRIRLHQVVLFPRLAEGVQLTAEVPYRAGTAEGDRVTRRYRQRGGHRRGHARGEARQSPLATGTQESAPEGTRRTNDARPMSAAAPCKPARERMRAEAEGGEAHATTKKNKKGNTWFLIISDNFIYLFCSKT